jgi:Putative Ig domain
MKFCFPKGARVALLGCVVALTACGGSGEGSSQAATAQAGSGSGSRIQGQPATAVAVSQRYSFQPITPNGSGGTLTYTASNLPGWLTIDSQTGRLTGTPTAADIATYSGLTISASDGSTTGPFSITVLAAGSGTASLSWMPPSSNIDGSALTDLSGFVVLYGNSPTELSQSISITNPSISTYVVESLIPGTWYFAVQAVNAMGVRSESSAIASKVVT